MTTPRFGLLVGLLTILALGTAFWAVAASADHSTNHQRLVVGSVAADCDTWNVTITPLALDERFDYRLLLNGEPVWNSEDDDSPYTATLEAGTYTALLQVRSGATWIDATGAGDVQWDPDVEFTLADLCPETPPAPTTGSISIEKRAAANGDLRFRFNVTEGNSLAGTFRLLRHREIYIADGLLPDTYTIVEDVPEGWRLDRIDCGEPSVRVVTSLNNRRVRINLQAGDEVKCVFFNEPIPVPTATPVPPTATPVPAATATPVPAATTVAPPNLVACVVGNSITFVAPGMCPEPTPVQPTNITVSNQVSAPAPVVAPQTVGTIKPPSTGDGGLVE